MFRNLRAEMARNDVFFSDLAKALNIRNATISDKINGKSRFYIDEAITIRDEFFPAHSIEYLFDDTEDGGSKCREVSLDEIREYAGPVES